MRTFSIIRRSEIKLKKSVGLEQLRVLSGILTDVGISFKRAETMKKDKAINYLKYLHKLERNHRASLITHDVTNIIQGIRLEFLRCYQEQGKGYSGGRIQALTAMNPPSPHSLVFQTSGSPLPMKLAEK